MSNNSSIAQSREANAQAMTEEIERLESAVLDARQTGDPAALGDALLALGRAYFETGNTPKGLTQVEEALEIALSTGNQEAEARLWGYKGMAFARLGNTQFAPRALFRSLKLATEIGHKALPADSAGANRPIDGRTGRK